MSSTRNTKMKIIIDCDPGIDDAQAIMIALSQEVDVLAITCTHGNVNVDQVTKNAISYPESSGSLVSSLVARRDSGEMEFFQFF